MSRTPDPGVVRCYHGRLRPRRFVPRLSRRLALVCVAATLLLPAEPASQPNAYTLYTAESRRSIPFRTSGGTDMVALDQLAPIFGLTFAEDSVVGGLTVRGRGQTILLIAGQSAASIGPGRIVSLPVPVQQDRQGWSVPVDFVRLVLGPALNVRTEIRRQARTILVGDVRLPHVSGRFERAGPGARLTLEIQPPAPHRIAREGGRLVIRFDAVALDLTPISGVASEFITGMRTEGPSLVIELGPSSASHTVDQPDAGQVAIGFGGAGAAPLTAPRPQEPDTPILDLPVPGSIRTVVLDPGHGGVEEGARGPAGTKEKDYALQLARRMKSTIETRIGIRVLLTREDDVLVPPDRRTSLANNNKADLFISLHANASARPESSGAQVLSLSLSDYQRRPEAASTREVPVPVVSGGSRLVEIVPWDLAQMPFAQKSAVVAAILTRHLNDLGVPLYSRRAARLPLRPLVGANMPAVMLEVGFLSNAADEAALNGPERSNAIVEAVLNTIGDVRQGVPNGPDPTP
jgi:N-acetylmuramoyl-L-alanine amidase